MLEPRPRALLRAFIAAAALALAAPSFATAADQLNLIDKTEPVGPGISLRHEKFVDASGWYDTQVLTVDLANSAVKSDLLTAPKVAQGEALTTMANRAGATAGVNGDFFDIDSTQASLGGEVKAGELIKSADFSGWAHVGVTKDGIGRLVDLTLQATANLNGTEKPVVTLNAASSGGIPAGSIIAYTSAWGGQIRGRSVAGVANVAEALVQDGKVVEVHTAAGSGAIPDGAFYLVGRDAGADAIKALEPGDPVTLTYGLKDEAARQMQWAIGTNKPLVQNGVLVPQGDKSVAPRTAIGFKDGGKTMFLLITDGRQTNAALGTTLEQTGQMLLDLGADTGLNLDGGGSTTLVARPLGGTTRDPAQHALRRPGARRSDRRRPVRRARRRQGRLARRLAGGPARLPGPAPHAQRGRPRRPPGARRRRHLGAHRVRRRRPSPRRSATSSRTSRSALLHPLRTLELSSSRLSFADVAGSQTLKVTGRDDEGYTAPIELQDMTLDYDHAVIKVEETAAGRAEDHAAEGGRHDARRQGRRPARAAPDHDRRGHADRLQLQPRRRGARWNVNGTTAANQKLDTDADGNLRLTYKAERNSGISAKTRLHDRGPRRAAAPPPQAELDAGAAVLLHHLPRRGQCHPRPARHAGQGGRR